MAREIADLLTRRQKVLDAAREVFSEEGSLDVGLRKIAARAGYTTGAIYKMFAGREDIYAALLEQSLTELSHVAARGASKEADPEAALRAVSDEIIIYYQSHKFEYQLGLYLFQKDGRVGLGAEKDRALNALLKDTMMVMQVCFQRLSGGGMTPQQALDRAHALFTALIGVLAIYFSKRDKSLDTDWATVLDTLVTSLILKPER